MGDKILVTDDSVSMRQMTSIILKQAGYEVIEAVDGTDALEKLNEDIKVLITDYNMPNMNGIELIKAVRSGSVNKSIPILMVTTESEDAKKQEGKQAGATGWITKPFDKETLVGTLKKIADTVEF
jgi:two-component system chemotaxis response regulator CheY